ncbi:TonB-dependent receptor [Mitsuaria sp. GD03876]|uniref:TonB-dependent receptor domain-containing protein n=1 Tax=Mitsuaria sp. GD03876 TaxID=2975399 RepID=UPI00244A3935|nr:TonB-dependent receptor [Mitsuaria sp. GD03876]MDH0863523.1 TonB-dependent receptor [Mitsuaria sp. GD03876]
MIPFVSRARAVARSLLVLTPVAVASAAFAQSAPLPASASRLDEVTVTGTRTPMKLSDVVADLTVINRDAIERQGFGNIAALLRNVAGIQMTSNGGPASNTSVLLRGAETRHTVVLIDGVRVDSQSTGGAGWQNLPVSQIERIEVLKGPASALYGSDAIGGVVQIFTRKGSGRTQLDLGVGGGNLGQAKADIGVSGSTAAFDYAASLAMDRGTGFNVYSRTDNKSFNPDRDGWRGYSGSLRLGGRVAEGQRLAFTGLKSRSNAGYDAGKNADDRTITDTLAARLSLDSTWSEALSTQLSAGQSEEDYETKPTSPYLTKTRIRSASLQGFYRFNEQHQLNGVLERREDRLVNTDLRGGGRSTRSQNAAGVGYLGRFGALSLQAHGRHDDDSDFGGVDTGNLAAGYQLGGGWRVTASAGSAFRAPTLYQRGSVYGPDTTRPGVEELRPERAHNREAGLAWAQGGFDVAVTTFHNRVTDLIAFGAAGTCPATAGCYGNIARALLKGTSLKGGAAIGPVNLSATADFLDPTDASTGRQLQRRAKRFGTLRADTTFQAWTLGATVVGSGARWDDAANKTRLGGYGLLNLDAQVAVAKDWRVQLNVDNAFNRAYQTANYYQQAPRTWFVSLRYTPTL